MDLRDLVMGAFGALVFGFVLYLIVDLLDVKEEL